MLYHRSRPAASGKHADSLWASSSACSAMGRKMKRKRGGFESNTVKPAALIDYVLKMLEIEKGNLQPANKKALETRAKKLYQLGITDTEELRLCLSQEINRAKKESLRLVHHRLGKLEKQIHQQNIVIDAMMRRGLTTDDAESLLSSLLETAEKLHGEYEDLRNDLGTPLAPPATPNGYLRLS